MAADDERTHVLGGTDRVQLDLWAADAVVLFDWLQSVDEESMPTDRPTRQALFDLLSCLERHIVPPSSQEISDARADVGRDIGW